MQSQWYTERASRQGWQIRLGWMQIAPAGILDGAPEPILDDMTGDAPTFSIHDQEATRIATHWEAAVRSRRGVDRLGLVTAFLGAMPGAAAASTDLSLCATSFGFAYAGTGGTFAALIDDLDELEGAVLAALPDSAARTVHANAMLTRRAAGAAFGQTMGDAARLRARVARHNLVNEIGAVRNAILLMEDEAGAAARHQFHAIAKRNAQSSQALVRAYFSEQNALSAALGWEEVRVSDLAAMSGDDVSVPVLANVAALETVLRAIRGLSTDAGEEAPADLSIALESTSQSAVVLRIERRATDRTPDSAETSALRALAAAVGLRLEDAGNGAALRLFVPVLSRDQRNDLAGAGERQHVDTVLE
jgi:hypothetical protein